jgi:hypothetical protein
VFRYAEYDEKMHLTPPVDIEVLGIDSNVGYGMTLRIKKENMSRKITKE